MGKISRSRAEGAKPHRRYEEGFGFLNENQSVQTDAKGTDGGAEQACPTGNFEDAAAEHVVASTEQPVLRLSDDRCAQSASASAKDEKHLVLKRILAAHETWFDVHRDYAYAGLTFPGYAEFHSHGERYVLVKRAKLWEADTHEYLFFVEAETLSEDEVTRWVEFMKTDGLKKVQPDPNHMSSGVSLVIIAESCTEEAKRVVRKTRFRKNFAFGIRGWADVRLVVADLSEGAVYANAAGKQMKPTIEANLRLAQPMKA